MLASGQKGLAIGEGQQPPFIGSRTEPAVPAPGGGEVHATGGLAEDAREQGVGVVQFSEAGRSIEANPGSGGSGAQSGEQFSPTRFQRFGRRNQPGALSPFDPVEEGRHQAGAGRTDPLQDDEVGRGEGIVIQAPGRHRHHVVEGGVRKEALQCHLFGRIGLPALDQGHPHTVLDVVAQVEGVVEGDRGIHGSDDRVNRSSHIVPESEHGVGIEARTQAVRPNGHLTSVDLEAQRQVVHRTLCVVGQAHMENLAAPGEPHRGFEPSRVDADIDTRHRGLGHKAHRQAGIRLDVQGAAKGVAAGLEVGEQVGRPLGFGVRQAVLHLQEDIHDVGCSVSGSNGGQTFQGFLTGQDAAVRGAEVRGEDLESVRGTGGFHQGRSTGFGGFQQGAVGAFQLHGGAVVDVEGEGSGAASVCPFCAI